MAETNTAQLDITKTSSQKRFVKFIHTAAHIHPDRREQGKISGVEVTAEISEANSGSANTNYRIKAEARFTPNSQKPIAVYQDTEYRIHEHGDGKLESVIPEYLNELRNDIVSTLNPRIEGPKLVMNLSTIPQ